MHDLRWSSLILLNSALEIIRRRRRREETESSEESPHVNIKLKKADHAAPLISQSESPPPSKQRADVKKIKKSSSARGNHADSKYNKSHNAKQKSQPLEEVDFVRVKPKDQIPITTFWTTLDPYFRNLTEEDREYLMQTSDQCKPYLIPPLGQHYVEKWAQEDQALGLQTSESKLKQLQHTMSANSQHDMDSSSLTDRLISSLVKENLLPEEIPHSDEDDNEEANGLDELGRGNAVLTDALEKRYNARTVTQLTPDPTEDIVGFEERLKRELRYAGLFGDEDVRWFTQLLLPHASYSKRCIDWLECKGRRRDLRRAAHVGTWAQGTDKNKRISQEAIAGGGRLSIAVWTVSPSAGYLGYASGDGLPEAICKCNKSSQTHATETNTRSW